MLADPLVGLSAITTNKEDAFYKTKTFSDVEWVKVNSDVPKGQRGLKGVSPFRST